MKKDYIDILIEKADGVNYPQTKDLWALDVE